MTIDPIEARRFGSSSTFVEGGMHLTLVMLTTAALVAAAAIETVNFDQAAAGQPPAGWTRH